MSYSSSQLLIEHDEQGPVADPGIEKPVKLTDKQRLFCAEYLADLNGTQAAIRAGYSEHTANVIASENLTKPYIQAEIQRLMSRRATAVNLTADYVLRSIIETAERCAQARPVLDKKGRHVMTVDEESGELVGVYQFDAANVLRANELLGKHLKLFGDKDLTQVNGPVTQININTDPETAARIYREMIER